MLEDKKGYDNSSNFKTKVLDVAQKELKEAYDKGQSDLYFDYQVKDKQGRKILSWFFFIHTKEEEQKPITRQSASASGKFTTYLQPSFHGTASI